MDTTSNNKTINEKEITTEVQVTIPATIAFDPLNRQMFYAEYTIDENTIKTTKLISNMDLPPLSVSSPLMQFNLFETIKGYAESIITDTMNKYTDDDLKFYLKRILTEINSTVFTISKKRVYKIRTIDIFYTPYFTPLIQDYLYLIPSKYGFIFTNRLNNKIGGTIYYYKLYLKDNEDAITTTTVI
jgi:hypothetical protein